MATSRLSAKDNRIRHEILTLLFSFNYVWIRCCGSKICVADKFWPIRSLHFTTRPAKHLLLVLLRAKHLQLKSNATSYYPWLWQRSFRVIHLVSSTLCHHWNYRYRSAPGFRWPARVLLIYRLNAPCFTAWQNWTMLDWQSEVEKLTYLQHLNNLSAS